MRAIHLTTLAAAFCLMMTGWGHAIAQDSPNRREMKRVELSGAPGMEVVSSITEYKPGDVLSRHFHHGVETAYVIQGAQIQVPGRDPSMLETGAVVTNLRDVVHGGFRIVGDKSLVLFTAHIVDKGKPLYAEPAAAAPVK